MPDQQLECPDCGATTFEWQVVGQVSGDIEVTDGSINTIPRTNLEIVDAEPELGVECQDCYAAYIPTELIANQPQPSLSDNP